MAHQEHSRGRPGNHSIPLTVAEIAKQLSGMRRVRGMMDVLDVPLAPTLIPKPQTPESVIARFLIGHIDAYTDRTYHTRHEFVDASGGGGQDIETKCGEEIGVKCISGLNSERANTEYTEHDINADELFVIDFRAFLRGDRYIDVYQGTTDESGKMAVDKGIDLADDPYTVIDAEQLIEDYGWLADAPRV